MNRRALVVISSFFVLLTAVATTYAGDDASGSTAYILDLSQKFTTYSMTAKDQQWSQSLVNKFKYKGRVVHFVRTSLPLKIGDREVGDAVYQAVEKPDYFYVLPGDAMLRIGNDWPYNPGVAGFSMHAPKSQKFLVCLNFAPGGVPFVASTRVTKGVVSWKGDPNRNRLN